MAESYKERLDAAEKYVVKRLQEAKPGSEIPLAGTFVDNQGFIVETGHPCEGMRLLACQGGLEDVEREMRGSDAEGRIKKTELLERARGVARAALRPATLAAEFGVPTERVVDAIAHALLPFVEAAGKKVDPASGKDLLLERFGQFQASRDREKEWQDYTQNNTLRLTDCVGGVVGEWGLSKTNWPRSHPYSIEWSGKFYRLGMAGARGVVCNEISDGLRDYERDEPPFKLVVSES